MNAKKMLRKKYELINDMFKNDNITYNIYLGNPIENDLFVGLSNIIVKHDYSEVLKHHFNQWYIEIKMKHHTIGLRDNNINGFLETFFNRPDNKQRLLDFHKGEKILLNEQVFKDLSTGHYFFKWNDTNYRISTKNNNGTNIDRENNFLNLHFQEHLGIRDFARLSMPELERRLSKTMNTNFSIVELKSIVLDIDFSKENEYPNRVYVIRNGDNYGYFEINDDEKDLFDTCEKTNHNLTGLSNDKNERLSLNLKYYTRAYLEKYATRCERCGDMSFLDHPNNLNLCNNCYLRIERDFNSLDATIPTTIDEYRSINDTIKGHSYSETLNFLNGKKARTPLYMGVELEVDTGGIDYDDYDEDYDEYRRHDGESYTNTQHNIIAKEVAKKLSPQGNAYFMWDGSLTNGFEIATHPATLHDHLTQFNYKDAFAYLRSKGYRSHDAGTCGLHVHIGRRFFGRTRQEQLINIGKLAYVMENNWGDFVKFSRRYDDQLSQWAQNSPDYLYKVETSDYDETLLPDLLRRTYVDRGKYSALNLQHTNTIELRIFRGTLNYDTFMKTLTMVDKLARLSKKLSLKDLTSITFSDIIKDNNTSKGDY